MLKSLVSCILALGLLLPIHEASAAPLEVSYEIDARVSRDHRLLTGHIRITVSADVPLHDLQLLMFPEHFSTRNPDLDDLTFPRVYPGAFSPGHLSFAPLQDGQPLEVSPMQGLPGWESGTLVSIKLASPSRPGTPLLVEGDFRLEIPKRYGVFGAVDRQVTLASGWYPLVLGHDGSSWDLHRLPPVTPVALTLRYPSGLVALLEGRPMVPGGCATTAAKSGKHAEQCSSLKVRSRYPGLVVGPLKAFPLAKDIPLTFYDSVDRPAERRELERLVHRALVSWRKAGLPMPEAPGPLVRASLHRVLATAGEREVLLSDHALRVFPLVRRFHEIPLIHALYQSWLMALRKDLEPAESLGWVCSGLAWQLIQDNRAALVSGELRPEEIIRRLSFLPAFDQMRYAPQFAFAGDIYERPYAFNAAQETVTGFIRPVSSGRVMFMKLEDRFSVELVQGISRAVLKGGDESFVNTLAERTHVAPLELKRLINDWERPYPQVNYVLEQVQRVRKGGKFETSFNLRRELIKGLPPEETVVIQITSGKDEQKLSWGGKDSSRMTVATEGRIRQIVLDPAQRLLETNDAGVILRDDNYWPRQYKALVSLGGSLDLSLLHPQADLALYLTNPNNRDWIGLMEIYSASPVGLGSSLGAFRYFGPYRDAQWRVHRVGLQAVVANRSSDETPEDGGASQFLSTAGLRASYRYESRQTTMDPRRGSFFYLGVEAGRAHSEQDQRLYTQISLAAIKPFAIHPRHVLVGRVQIDAGLGLQSGQGLGLFTLGGPAELRALPPDEGAGNLRWLASLEYRALVFQGLDIDLWALRVHGTQLVAFSDIGKVADRLADLPRPVVGYGVGVRIFAEIGGVWPAVLGLDLARLEDGRFRPILRLAQPF